MDANTMEPGMHQEIKVVSKFRVLDDGWNPDDFSENETPVEDLVSADART